MSKHVCRLCGKPATVPNYWSSYWSCEAHRNSDILRFVHFQPYLKGKGPTFTLLTWDCRRYHRNGPQWQVGYRLTMRENGKSKTIFCGEDFGCSPLHAIDSDACVKDLMGFLTLRPGDTDRKYFENYTPEQLEYCEQHAEALDCAVHDRFGWED